MHRPVLRQPKVQPEGQVFNSYFFKNGSNSGQSTVLIPNENETTVGQESRQCSTVVKNPSSGVRGQSHTLGVSITRCDLGMLINLSEASISLVENGRCQFLSGRIK